MKHYIKYMILLVSIASCDNYLDPNLEKQQSDEIFYSNPANVEGLILYAYNSLSKYYDFNTDVASDDAVTNLKDSDIRKMVNGGWTSNENPVGFWNIAYDRMQMINLFLEKCETVTWDSKSKVKNDFYIKRLKGEAYALRGYFGFELLKHHAGLATNGQLLGYPIVTKYIEFDGDIFLERNTYQECIDQIMSDYNMAIDLLPFAYDYSGQDGDTLAYNGGDFQMRLNGKIVRGLKSRAALFAASDAFSIGNDMPWDSAAVIAGELIADMGGLSILENANINFYTQTNKNLIKSLPELMWVMYFALGNNAYKDYVDKIEKNNLPPSKFGKGITNPTHDLVSAFPLKTGYPIDYPDTTLSMYDKANPYNNRDNRLEEYIVYNGSMLGPDTIFTSITTNSKDGIDKQPESTRTGYYLRKFINPNVRRKEDLSWIKLPHYYTFFRFTELALIYAEAANEAWGPDDNRMGFSAREVLAALRVRAGIDPADPYLYSLNMAQLKEQIRIERRCELCFEGHRFWDIRRWNEVELMKTPVNKVEISVENSKTTYVSKTVENRLFKDYMIYPPIPYTETLLYDIEQNAGW